MGSTHSIAVQNPVAVTGGSVEIAGVKKPTLCALVAMFLLVIAGRIGAAEPAHDFAKWEKEIAAYEAADRAKPPQQGGLLFTGASAIRRWTTLAQDFPKHRVLNRGVGGSEIVDLTHFVERIVFPYAPRMIFIRSGGNDIFRGKSPEDTFADFKAFVETVHARLPMTDVVFISQNPTVARAGQWEKERTLNARAAAYARAVHHVGYIDVADMVLGPDGQPRLDLFVADKLHFSPAGYKLLAERIRPHLPK